MWDVGGWGEGCKREIGWGRRGEYQVEGGTGGIEGSGWRICLEIGIGCIINRKTSINSPKNQTITGTIKNFTNILKIMAIRTNFTELSSKDKRNAK